MYSMSIKVYGCSVHPEQLIISYKIVLFLHSISIYLKNMLAFIVIQGPIGSMYGIYANIWGILMVNVTIYIYIYHTWILWVLYIFLFLYS